MVDNFYEFEKFTNAPDEDLFSSDAWEIYFAQIDKNKCTNCHRELVNKDMKVKNGCVWCVPPQERKNG